MHRITIIISIVGLVFINSLTAQNKNAWIEDIDYLVEKYESVYPAFSRQIDSAQFYALVDFAKANIKTDNSIHNIMSLFKIHASLKDAHSIPMVFHPSYNLHGYPIRLHKFQEGWFVSDAMHGYEELIGFQVLKVQNVPIENIYERSSEIISSENEFGKLDRFEMFGLIAEWLKMEGVTGTVDSAQFTFVDNQGYTVQKYMPSMNYIEVFKWINMTPIIDSTNFALFNPRQRNYWFNYDQGAETLYFQFNSVSNQEGHPTIADFTNDLKKIVNRKKVTKFVIDLRYNGGGDDSNLPPLLSLIKDSKKINQYGKLFVITGRHTFSSAALFAWQLQLQTEAIFIGEPSAQGPVFNANADYVFLPNSKLGFTISKTSTARNQPNWFFEPPKTTQVDLPVQYSIANFTSNVDPAMELISKLHIEISPDYADKDISGSYRLSDFHILNIRQQKKGFVMEVTDFMDNSLFYVKKQITFDKDEGLYRDENGVFTIHTTKNNGELVLGFDGQDITAKKRDSEDMLPIEAMKKKDYAKAIELFRKYADTYKRDYIKFEYYLTMAGYNLLSAGKTDISLRFFKLLIEIFPDSWNAYDSYGEALIEAGQKENAIQNFKRSLQLNPENENGKKWLEKLKE